MERNRRGVGDDDDKLRSNATIGVVYTLFSRAKNFIEK